MIEREMTLKIANAPVLPQVDSVVFRLIPVATTAAAATYRSSRYTYRLTQL